jgi:hypothetical protein
LVVVVVSTRMERLLRVVLELVASV